MSGPARIARFTIRPDGLEDARAAIRTFVDAIRANEPGTRTYVSYELAGSVGEFVHLMVFNDDAAMEHHRGTAHVLQFVDALYPLTVDGVRFDDLVLVADA